DRSGGRTNGGCLLDSTPDAHGDIDRPDIRTQTVHPGCRRGCTDCGGETIAAQPGDTHHVWLPRPSTTALRMAYPTDTCVAGGKPHQYARVHSGWGAEDDSVRKPPRRGAVSHPGIRRGCGA